MVSFSMGQKALHSKNALYAYVRSYVLCIREIELMWLAFLETRVLSSSKFPQVCVVKTQIVRIGTSKVGRAVDWRNLPRNGLWVAP